MFANEMVTGWLLDYACYHKMYPVLHDFCTGNNVDVLKTSALPVRMACAVIDSTISEMDSDNFENVLHLMSFIYERVDGLVTFKLFDKIASGLKILILFELLKSNVADCILLGKVNVFFPRHETSHPKVDKKFQRKVHTAKMKFRRFFLPLIANEVNRKAYLRDEYQEEFGDNFQKPLKNLTAVFLRRISDNLPLPVIDRLLSSDFSPGLLNDLTNQPSAEVEILLDALQGVSALSQDVVGELLSNLCKPSSSGVGMRLVTISSDEDSRNLTQEQNNPQEAIELSSDSSQSLLQAANVQSPVLRKTQRITTQLPVPARIQKVTARFSFSEHAGVDKQKRSNTNNVVLCGQGDEAGIGMRLRHRTKQYSGDTRTNTRSADYVSEKTKSNFINTQPSTSISAQKRSGLSPSRHSIGSRKRSGNSIGYLKRSGLSSSGHSITRHANSQERGSEIIEISSESVEFLPIPVTVVSGTQKDINRNNRSTSPDKRALQKNTIHRNGSISPVSMEFTPSPHDLPESQSSFHTCLSSPPPKHLDDPDPDNLPVLQHTSEDVVMDSTSEEESCSHQTRSGPQVKHNISQPRLESHLNCPAIKPCVVMITRNEMLKHPKECPKPFFLNTRSAKIS